MAIVATALWRRLDTPGHEACRLETLDAGWRLQGVAVFRHESGPDEVAYMVDCNGGWEAVSGQVRGSLGDRPIDYAIAREGRTWTLNGVVVRGLERFVDLDLAFSPSTNLTQMRRLVMKTNERVEVPVAWLDIDAGTLTELPQFYERRSETTFWYESPSTDYETMLELAPNGFVRRYPPLWEMEG